MIYNVFFKIEIWVIKSYIKKRDIRNKSKMFVFWIIDKCFNLFYWYCEIDKEEKLGIYVRCIKCWWYSFSCNGVIFYFYLF